MKLRSMFKGAALIGAMVLPALPAQAQDKPNGMPFTARMSRTFGPTGLISEFGQSESYGSVQTRLAQSRAEIAAANADNVFVGYEDHADKINVPVTLTFSTPGNNGAFRVKGTYLGSWAEPNMTYADSAGFSGLVQYLTMPGPNTLLGFGVLFGATDVDIKHNGGSIDAKNAGLQFDLLHNLNDHWGLSARAIFRRNETETVIPLGFADLVTDQGSDTTYTELGLVGNFEHDRLAFVPEGWLLRPKIRALYTRTSFETVTNSLGGTNVGTVGPSDEYATLSLRMQMLQPVFRPGQSGFYFEAGFERELINDLNLVVDDPNILLAKAGYQKMFKDGMFMDLGLAMERGTEGQRSQNALTMVFSKNF